MSESERGSNEDAPRVGTDERRDDQAESRAGESAPRRDGDVR
jgi:hypothetical protein